MRLLNKITMTEADFAFRKTVDITPGFLKKHGIKGLILDVDNTLTTHDNPVPAEGITEWLENMRSSGIKLIIVSNNHPERVKPFADPLGLDFVSDSGKPLRKGYTAAMKKMGVDIRDSGGQIVCRAKNGRAKGTKLSLSFPSVGATENIILCAVTAEGETVINNAAREPEICDLCGFLRACGAEIKGDGGSRIIINGRERLHGCDYAIIFTPGQWM